ncbi:MAG: hypothetical protein RIT81_41170 [Deltaproteobacteria bacterium]
MIRSAILRSTLLVAGAATLLACPGPDGDDGHIEPKPLLPIQSSSALTAANANLRAMSVGVAKSSLFLESSDFFGGLLNGDGAIPCDPEGNCEQPDPETLEERATAMADMMAERVLNETNVETSEPTKVVLSLKAEAFCANGTDEAGDPIIDADCATRLAADPIRLELTQRTEGDIDVALLVGAAALRPVTLELYRKQLATQLDIGAAVQAAEIISSILGEPIEGLDGELSGKVRFEIRENRELDYTIATSILAPVKVAMNIEGEALSVNVGVASPLSSMRIDGNNQTLVTETDSGAIDVSLPLGAIGGSTICTTNPDGETICETEPSPFDGAMELHIPGAHGKVTLDASDTIKVENLGYDDVMTMKIDGAQIFSMDLNASNGRSLDAELTGSEDGFILAVRPLIDLVIDLDVTSLVDEMEIPAGLSSDRIQMRLDGDSNPAIRLAGISDAPTTGDDEPSRGPASVFEVLRGRFSLSSQAANAEVVVEAGQCLVAAEPTEENPEQHPIELLQGAACN